MVDVKEEQPNQQILSISFNQDGSCFAIGSQKGFRIYNSYPFKENIERQLEGGIGIVEMLYKTNIIALVGGGSNPKYTLNKVILWDDNQMKAITELRVTSYIRNVKLKKDKIFVVCEQKIYVLKFVTLQNIDTIETYNNAKGIIAVSTDPKVTIIAYPDKIKGYVKVKNYDKNMSLSIVAHESAIAFLSMNIDGSLLATASDKGTLIRLYRTDTGEFLHEVRRGSDKAEIYSVCFNSNSKLLACSSDKGTIHIFSLDKIENKLKENPKEDAQSDEKAEVPKNTKSMFSVFKGILPKYFASEWSFAQFRISDTKPICSFLPDSNKLIVVSEDCKYYEISFDVKNGGECTVESSRTLLIQ